MDLLAKFAYFISMVFLSRRAKRELKQGNYTFGDVLGGIIFIVLVLIGISILVAFLPAILPIIAVLFFFYLIGRKA